MSSTTRDDAPASAAGGSTAGLWSTQRFRTYFLATAISAAGDGFTLVALPLAVLATGGDAATVGLVLSARALPMVLLMLPAGVVADRYRPERVMFWTNLVRFLSQLATAVALATGQGGAVTVALLAAVAGAASAFHFPASMSYLPRRLEPGVLQRANALVASAYDVAAIGSPLLAGLLLTVAQPALAIGVDSLSYLVGAVLLARLRAAGDRAGGGRREPGAADGQDGGWLREITATLREIARTQWLWVTFAHAALFHLVVLATVSVAGPVIAVDRYGGAGAWAAVSAALGAGRLTGSLATLRWQPARPLFSAYLCALGVVPAMLAMAWSVPLAVLVVACWLFGSVLAVVQTLYMTTVQRLVPQDRLAKVFAVDGLVSFSLQPVAFAGIGIAFTWTGAPPLFLTGALAAVGGTVAAAVLSRYVRSTDS